MNRRAVIATVALALSPGLFSVSAGAAEGASPSHPSPAATSAGSQARRQIDVQGLEPKPNKFYIKGKVSPKYAHKKVYMLKKVGTGSFKRSNEFKTDGQSKFKVRVAGPPSGVKKVCYQALIPAGGGFKKSQSKALCVVRL